METRKAGEGRSNPTPKHDEGPAKDKGDVKEFPQPKPKDKIKPKDPEGENAQSQGGQSQSSHAVGGKDASFQATGIDPAAAKTQIAQVNALLKSMVAQLKVGKIGEAQELANLNLKPAPTVPKMFEGANILMTVSDLKRVDIKITFVSPQAQNDALRLMTNAQNQEQLVALAQSLSAKSLALSTISLGDNPLTLPPGVAETLRTLPPPTTLWGGSEWSREGGGQQGGGQQQGDQSKDQQEQRERR